MEIMVDHFQSSMPEYFLKRKDVATIEQIVDSKSVAAEMSVKTNNT